METAASKVEVGSKEPKRKELVKRLRELNEEYRVLTSEANAGNSAALNRRSEIGKELRALSLTLHLREPDVEVQVPRSVTGHAFRVGDATFHPGRHTVKASVAQYLLWLIYKNREDELNRLRQNGETVDLGAIGDKASQTEREF